MDCMWCVRAVFIRKISLLMGCRQIRLRAILFVVSKKQFSLPSWYVTVCPPLQAWLRARTSRALLYFALGSGVFSFLSKPMACLALCNKLSFCPRSF